MARPRTATNILNARGAFKTHPERKRTAEPESTNPFPKTAPKHLNAKQKKCWNEIVKIAPAKVLTGADVIIVEVAACLLSEFREEKGNMNTARLTRLTSEIGKIGLSPSSRAGLIVDNTKGNKFD